MTADSEPEARAQDETAEPNDELERAYAERDRFLTQLQRAQADYQNLKKRTASDVEIAVRRTLTPLFEQVLLAIDNLDLALSAATSAQESELARGVQLTRDQLLRGLELAGVQRIESRGSFDPLRQEAVATQEREDVEPGTVLEVLREGYTFQGQVLRPAQVRVAARSTSAASGADTAETI
jgi:molecular chaperone GrpE